MNLAEFLSSLRQPVPPANLSPVLQALWWDGKKNWKLAHEVAQDVESPAGAWVHAYLHRKEGDEVNAGYWYRRADKPHPSLPVGEEWEEIVKSLLGTTG